MSTKEKKVGLYSPIPQWLQKEDKVVGIKDLYIVKTCGSDYFIRKEEETFMVLNATMKEKLLESSSMEDALSFIKETCEANLVYGYKIIFEFSNENKEVFFKTNASKDILVDACELFPYRGELNSRISKEECPDVFVKIIKEVFGYLIQEETSLSCTETLTVMCKND